MEIPVFLVAELEKVTTRMIVKRIQSGKIKAKKEHCSVGAPQGEQWMVELESLSLPAQQRWAKRIAAKEEFKAEEKEASQVVIRGPQDIQGVLPSMMRDHVKKEIYEVEMNKAREKYLIVEKAKNIRGSGDNVVERMKAFAKSQGTTAATLYRWIQAAQIRV